MKCAHSRRFSLSLCVAALTTGACAGGEKTVIEPPPTTNTDFTINVRVESAESAASQKLGWSGGIPSADVTVVGSDLQSRSLQTNTAGAVTFTDLKDGKYTISVRRILTPDELIKVSGTDVAAFVGQESTTVAVGARTTTINTLASRRKSLVISEYSSVSALITGVGGYYFGGFVELYNNSDTTIYLDGVTFSEGISDPVENPNFSCASIAPFRNDPEGVWTNKFAAFPGTGRTYPLLPGVATLVATDAIDQRSFSPTFLDLSRANFEFFGEADVDNPEVPNMVYLGLEPYPLGHGLAFVGSTLSAVGVISTPIDARTLTKATDPNGVKLVRIPVSTILDAFVSRNTGLLDPSRGLTPCPQLVSQVIDRQEGFFSQDDPLAYARSAHRKALTTLPNGKVILQDTKMSALDFRNNDRTPGVVRSNQ